MQNLRVVLHSRDNNTFRDLRLLLAEWCELHAMGDSRSLDHYCREHGTPVAVIFENAMSSPLDVRHDGEKDAMSEFLAGVRARYPTVRRVVIADLENLSATINGLHARSIDSLLHRPFTLGSVLTALRLEKAHAGPTNAAECATT